MNLIGMAYLNEIEGSTREEDPLILELGFLPEKRRYYITAFHLNRDYADGIGKWDSDKPFHICQLARFWGNVTGDDETVERLLEIHDDLLKRTRSDS